MSGDFIDLVYSQVVADERLKHGTKLERLAALIFKYLNPEDEVIHDVRLRGEGKRTRHQIDVSVREPEQRLRWIIECRHLLSTSKRNRITLGAVRDFASVVRDLVPENAVMLTTVGYTEPARTYANEQGIQLANDQGIQLAVLREFTEDDWEGRVRRIVVKMRLLVPSTPRITGWTPVDQAEQERVKPLLMAQGDINMMVSTRDHFFLDARGKETESFFHVLDPIIQNLDLREGPNSGHADLDKQRWIRIGTVEVAVRGFSWEMSLTAAEQEIVVEAPEVLTLILQTADGQIDEVVTATHLRALGIGSDGRVAPRLA